MNFITYLFNTIQYYKNLTVIYIKNVKNVLSAAYVRMKQSSTESSTEMLSEISYLLLW